MYDNEKRAIPTTSPIPACLKLGHTVEDAIDALKQPKPGTPALRLTMTKNTAEPKAGERE